MTKLTPENYVSLESRKPNLPQGVLAMFAYEGRECHVLGFEISLKSHFGSKICNMNFPFLEGGGGGEFSATAVFF